jgi:hypothetical protein
VIERLEDRHLLATQLLPDLMPWANASRGYLYNWSIDTLTMPGHTLLRLTAANANIGTGVMQLVGGAPNGDGTQQVFQRIFNSDGTFTDRLAGNFVYHPTHHHFHFENFCEYDLLARPDDNSVGSLVAGGSKTSFCLEDVDVYNKSLPGAPQSPVYVDCSDVLQGVSVGWADVYTSQLDGQWVDITGVPDGKYWLQIVDDPQNRLVESNENNNTTRIAIDLHVNDDTRATAYDVGALSSPISYDEFVGSSDPNDFYKLTVKSPQTLTLNMNGLSDDADLKLLGASGNPIAKSAAGGNIAESIVESVGPGTYYVQVLAFSGDTTYHLAMSQSPVTAPAAPSNLIATPLSASQIKLTWIDNADNNTNYIVERSTDGKLFTPLPSIGDVATFTDSGLSSGKKYYYEVRATLGALSSDFSNIASATTHSSLTLIAAGSTWKYLDNGTDQKSGWRATSFNDSTWKSGKAQLGYGDGDEATVVKFGSNSSRKYITTYFRQKFTLKDPTQITSLSAQLIRDDGAAVFLNNHEVWRSNMPTGTIGYRTLATKSITGSDESKWQIASINKSWLLAGTNLIAVEIHQSSPSSPDISFDFKLTGISTPPPALAGAVALGSLFSKTPVDSLAAGILS